ncbi:hypothetical protein [Streptomyces vulcanius]|uniref:RING-type domain-containing protein n=3 Tax=Streptomyces TaxID=1883 RepID=A0ABV9IP47_9ACTN
MLQAVERRVSRPGIAVSLSAPGAASLSWQSVFECGIVRSIERRDEYHQRARGRSVHGGLAKRATYTDLVAHPVTPPSDPGTPKRTELIREGSLGEVACGDCVEGRKDCKACKGAGSHACHRHVECDMCRGGPDACWECDGTGHPRTHRVRRTASRPEGAAERAECTRCRRPEVACPRCLGERQVPCPRCQGAGQVTCEACMGQKRLRHEECGGTGVFTVWTEGVVTHTPDADELASGYPPLTRLRKGAWRTAELTAATEKLPDFVADAHRERLVPLLAVRDGEVRRRVTLRCLPVARVTIPGDPDHVFYAFPGNGDDGGIEVIRRPSRERVKALAWAAAAVVALAAVLTLTFVR